MLALADSPTKSKQSKQFKQLADWSDNGPPSSKHAAAKVIGQWAIQNSPPNKKHSDTIGMLLAKAAKASPTSRRAKQILKRLENATGICHQLSTVVPQLVRALETETDKGAGEQGEGRNYSNDTSTACATASAATSAAAAATAESASIPITTSDNANLSQSIHAGTGNISSGERCSSAADLAREEGASKQPLESKAEMKSCNVRVGEASATVETGGVVVTTAVADTADIGEEKPSAEAWYWEEAEPVNAMIPTAGEAGTADTTNMSPTLCVSIGVSLWLLDIVET